jgi:hypothetical protein
VKVRSTLANMDVSIGEVRRRGSELHLKSAPGSSIDADITVSAGEALRILAKILTSAGGLAFLLGLPYFWIKERLGTPPGGGEAPNQGGARSDINKPW